MTAPAASAPTRDTLPMAVANMPFLVNRLNEDCSPLQYIREMTQNSIESIKRLGGSSTGLIHWDVAWQHHKNTGNYKLSCVDTGVGMTGPEMVKYINALSSSFNQQSATGNFGVGAKIAAAPLNPHGLIYMSWQGDVGHIVQLWFDEKAQVYGLKRHDSNNGQFWGLARPEYKPDIIKDHGTVVVFLGKASDHDTMVAPPGTQMPARWILRYLTERYFKFPKGIEVAAREGWTKESNRYNFMRNVTGQGTWLEENKESSGSVKLSDATAHWWIIKDGVDTNSGHNIPLGHTAALLNDELYEVAKGRPGSIRLQTFGIIFGHDRVSIYLQPTSDRVAANTARSHLQIDGEPLPWADWAAEFRAQMPQELKELQERITANSHEADHKKAILERLRQIRDLLRFSRYRKNPNGKEKADHGMSNDAGGGGSGGEGGGGGLGGEGAQGRKRPKNAGDDFSMDPHEDGDASTGVNALTEPDRVWVSVEAGTRDPDDLEDRAARYLDAQNYMVINADFRGFTDMVDRWARQYEHVPGSRPTIRDVAHEWFEQQLVETVMAAHSLRGSGKFSSDEVQRLWSEEALTAAVLPRWHIDQSIRRVLGTRLGSLKNAAAA